MKIVTPSVDYFESYCAALKEFDEHGITGFWKFFGPLEDAQAYIAKLKLYEHRSTAPAELVPASVFWLVEDGAFIGHTSIRHELNESLQKVGGHIGFHIRPSQHGKGYGTMILKLALDKAKKLGIHKALVTCDKDNLASKRVIEKNGGVLENEIDVNGVKILRFWIKN